MHTDGDATVFQHQAESWLNALWGAVRAKLPPTLARLAPGSGNSTATAAGNMSTLDLASLPSAQAARILAAKDLTTLPSADLLEILEATESGRHEK